MLAAFACSCSVFILLVLHTFFIINNWSTLEYSALMSKNIFKNHSYGKSWRLVMGDSCLVWFLPVWTPDLIEALDYHADVEIPNIVHESEE